MHITWHGHYTIKIVTKEVTLVLDPHSSEVNSTAFKAKSDIVSLSNPEESSMSSTSGIQGDFKLIDTPGEYAINGLTLYSRGWHDKVGHEHTIQRWHIEDTTLLHLGALNRELEETELQELEQTNIDILFLPVGGDTGLDTQKALNILSTIEPSIVIPVNYKTKKSKNKLDTIDEFAKEVAADPKSAEQKLSITGKKIDRENLTTVILSS